MLLVGFDLGVYIIGALVGPHLEVYRTGGGPLHPPSGVITSESTMGISGHLMPAVFTPEG